MQMAGQTTSEVVERIWDHGICDCTLCTDYKITTNEQRKIMDMMFIWRADINTHCICLDCPEERRDVTRYNLA
jgi:hypothetical protein